MKPLEGIRVLDFTRVVAGPLATRVLADQGAEVIKVEPPEGDLSRTFPPVVGDGTNPYFAHQNAGKRFVSLDLRADGATELVLELLEHCDVLVENYRPGVMARLGLGPDTVCEQFPRLVYCSVTGFGQDGPWADRRAYAPVGHLESGLLAHDELKTGRPARQPAITLGDATAALMAANSVNALLVQAARTGAGGQLDVCMVESLLFIQEWVSTELAGGCESPNAGACEECPILRLPDGRVWGIAGNPIAWFDHLATAMERPELLDDPRFVDPPTREAHRADIEDLLTSWAATFETFDDFRDALESRSPFTTAELHDVHDLAGSDFAAHRELFTVASNGARIPSRPARGAGIGTTGRVAARGADNAAVLGELLGHDAARIQELFAAGVLSAHPTTESTP
jgi:CoA:oxalate CoA-transferase